MPLTASPSGSITTTLIYDGDGGRVKRIVGATTTRYISPLYECDNSSCNRYIWAGDTRIAILPDNPTGQPCNPACYFHADHLSSTNLVTDATGARVETLTYQPYGEITTDRPGTPVNIAYKYTGQTRDASTGLLYYHARYYDPRLGRFLSPDTLVSRPGDPQDLNRYTYARNNPLLYTDPTGHFFKHFFKHFFRNVSRLVTEPIQIAKEIGHKPLNLLSPTFWLESSYRVHPALLPFRASGVLRDELDAGQRTIHRFRESRTGHWVDAGVIVTASAIATFYCGGCAAPGAAPTLFESAVGGAYIGATVGSASGLAQAAFTGGDPFQAAALGGLIGAAGGAVGGGIGNLANTGLASLLPASLPNAAAAAASNAFGLFTGAVAGGTFGGGLSAVAGNTNIGQGLAFGALGGAIGGTIQIGPIGDMLSSTLGEAGGFGVYGENGIKPPARTFINGGLDWTSGWFSTQTEGNEDQ
ncbi:MAG: RHS repeat-associated core domain-containing protein [Nitrospira sp.]